MEARHWTLALALTPALTLTLTLTPLLYQAEDRALAGPTAPAAGLRLEHVEYEEEWAASHWDRK